MRVIAVVSGAIILAAGYPNPASAAVTAPSPAATGRTAIVQPGCADGLVDGAHIAAARSPDGRIRGFMNYRDSGSCQGRITYLEGSGTSWRLEDTRLSGQVIDVAADRTGTYLLSVVHEIAESAELAVLKRASDGTITRQAIIAPVDESQPQDGHGSIVAANGTWYAVWPQYTGTPGRYVLHQAETMFGGGAEPGAFAVGSPPATTAGIRPELALGPDGQPRLFWQRPAAGGTRDLLFATGAYGAWGAISRVAVAEPVSADFAALGAAVTADRTFLSWTRRTDTGDRVVVAASTPGSWRMSTPPAEDGLASWDAHIAAAGSTVYAAYGSGDGAPDGAFMGSKSAENPWSASDATAGIPRSIDGFGVAALTYAGNGRSTALIYSGNTLYAVTR